MGEAESIRSGVRLLPDVRWVGLATVSVLALWLACVVTCVCVLLLIFQPSKRCFATETAATHEDAAHFGGHVG